MAESSITSKILSLNLAPYPKQKSRDSKRRPYLPQQLPCCRHGKTAVKVCWAPSNRGQQQGIHVLSGGLVKLTVQPQPWDPLYLSPTNFLPRTAQNRVTHTKIKIQDVEYRVSSFNCSDSIYVFSRNILFINSLLFPCSLFFPQK